MRRTVYRVLDRPFSMLGLKGRYFYVFLVLLALGALVSLIVGACTNSLVGSALLIVLMVLGYLAITFAQSFFSEREIMKFIWSKRIKDFIVLQPRKLHGQWK